MLLPYIESFINSDLLMYSCLKSVEESPSMMRNGYDGT